MYRAINKNGRKTKFNNSIFYKCTLENKVALEPWNWRIFLYQFSSTTVFKVETSWVDAVVGPLLLFLSSRWQLGDYLDILLPLVNPRDKSLVMKDPMAELAIQHFKPKSQFSLEFTVQKWRVLLKSSGSSFWSLSQAYELSCIKTTGIFRKLLFS